MTPEILILSGLYDFSTDIVCLRLQEHGVPFLRLNIEQAPEWRLTLDPSKPELIAEHGGRAFHVGPKLRSIWYRQPVFLRNTPAEPLSPTRQLERSQWLAFLRSLCVFDQAAWMNFPANTYLAECKPYQLHAAKSCNFKVPATLGSNDHTAIQAKFPRSAIIKSLDTVLLRENEDCFFTYSTLNDTSTLSDNNVKQAPLLAQEYLHPKKDIRVTIVGGTVFAVTILSGGNGIDSDWRTLPRDAIEYADVELTEQIRESCLSLTKRLGLAFSAIDLIETPDNVYFIEINPTGEWGWLSSPERPIDGAIARWLREATPQAAGGRV